MAKTTALLYLLLIMTTTTLSSAARPRVTITNNTPLAAEVVCRDESVPFSTYGTKTLNSTNSAYQFSVTHTSATSSCTAYWNTHYFVNWDAFSPGRDRRLKSVYWSIRQRGVYYSRDRLKWRLQAVWGHE
ncbi:unnamed protein product [Rhodiola kirilowii]